MKRYMWDIFVFLKHICLLTIGKGPVRIIKLYLTNLKMFHLYIVKL